MNRIKFTLALLTAALAFSSARAGDDKGFKPLFNGKNMDGFKFFLKDDKADPAKSFIVKDGVIQVPGDVFGYFYTEKSFKNYVIRYSWTYPKDQPDKTTMNSGCLIHIQTPHKVWPYSVEPQVRYMDHGKLFFIGFAKDAKKEQKFDEAAQKKALKPSYEWNTSEVVAKADGSIEVRINGTLVNTGKSELTSGPIGFQSEGAHIQFKDIQIKVLGGDPAPKKAAVTEPKKVEPKKVAPDDTAPKKVEPKKVAPDDTAPKKLAPGPDKTEGKPPVDTKAKTVKTPEKLAPPVTTQPGTTPPSATEATPQRRGIFSNLRARLRGLRF